MLQTLALAAVSAVAGPAEAVAPAAPALAHAGPALGTATLGTATVTADLFAAPVSVGPTDRADETRSSDADTVSIKTRDGVLLSASYYAPKSSKAKAPAALLIHDAGKSRDELEDLAEYLYKKGFAVLAVDLRGHGKSATKDVDWSKADDKGRESLWSLASRDVDAAAGFLLEQKSVHSTNLSVFGCGAGCSLVVRHAIDDENTRAIMLADPEPMAFGYNLANGIADLGGLPTLVLASKDGRDVALRLQSHGHDCNGGLEYVEISQLKAGGGEILDDKRFKNSSATWLRGQVMPKK